MLTEDWWLTPMGSFDMGHSEHSQFAGHLMLMLPDNQVFQRQWINRGVPEQELETALERGADPKAIEFLRKKYDTRLWAIREWGWVRTQKNRFNLWVFDKQTADLIRSAKDYWRSQERTMSDHEMMDVEEFGPGRDKYSISVKALLNGGNPSILKNLACGRIDSDCGEKVSPAYSTAKYSEMERDRLYARSGGNNPRRRKR